MRKMRSDALLWNENICERFHSTPCARVTFLFCLCPAACATASQSRDLLLFCNSPSKPIVQCQQQPLPANRNQNGNDRQIQGRRVRICYFLMYLVIFNICAIFSVWIIICRKAYCLHSVTFRNTMH